MADVTQDIGIPDAEAVDAGPEIPEGGEVVMPTPAPEAEVFNPDDPANFVEMWHPGPGDDTSLVTRKAYGEQWAAEGWREVVGRTEEGGLILAAAINFDPEGDDSGGDAGGSTDQADAEPATEGPAPDDPIGTESDVGSRSRSRSTK